VSINLAARALGSAGADIAGGDLPVVLAALRDAARARGLRILRCKACQDHPDDTCAAHIADADAMVSYRVLARQLGG
jgi:hypothetical protein